MKCRTGAQAGAAAIVLALAGCASQPPAPDPIVAVQTPGTSGGPVTATATSPPACHPRLAAWLHTAGGAVMLRVIRADVAVSSADLRMVDHDLLASGASIAGDAGQWHADLQRFQRDLQKLQLRPPPACGPGIPLGQAVRSWQRAVAGYQAGAADLVSSPTMTGASQAASQVTAAGGFMARAELAANRAASGSAGLVPGFPAAAAP